jgi:F0F1-type ATP synthase assembly protein I
MTYEGCDEHSTTETRPWRGYAYGGPALIGGILVGAGLGVLFDDFFA